MPILRNNNNLNGILNVNGRSNGINGNINHQMHPTFHRQAMYSPMQQGGPIQKLIIPVSPTKKQQPRLDLIT